jgi:hypothetical protein
MAFLVEQWSLPQNRHYRGLEAMMEQRLERGRSFSKECAMLDRHSDRRGKANGQDLRAWLVIGAVFVVTMLAVWIPLLFSAMHS